MRVRRSSIVALAVFVVVTGFFFERFPFHIAAATPARLAFGVGIVTAMIALYQSRTPMVISRNLFVYCYFIWFALLLVVHGDVGPFRQQATSIVTASFFLVLARYLDERHLPKLIVAAGLVMAAVSWGLFVLPSFAEAIGLRSAHFWLNGRRIPRLVGASNDPNFTAWVLDIVTVTALAMAVRARGRGQRIVWSLAAAVFAAVALLTWSRGGIVALVIGLAFQLYYASRYLERRPLVLVSSLGLLGATVVIVLLSLGGSGGAVEESVTQALKARFTSRPFQDEPRLVLWHLGLQEIIAGPLFGKGFPVLVLGPTGNWRYIHNTWIEVAVGRGLMGVVFFLGAWIWAGVYALRLPVAAKLWVLPVFVVTTVAATFLSAVGTNLLWWVMFLPEVVAASIRRSRVHQGEYERAARTEPTCLVVEKV